jgi:hypothetical protein
MSFQDLYKSCPFCGESVRDVTYYDMRYKSHYWRIVSSCGIATDWYSDREYLLNIWNRRPELP